MSKTRVIILSVEVEGLTQFEAAALYGASKSWVSQLMATGSKAKQRSSPSHDGHTSPTDALGTDGRRRTFSFAARHDPEAPVRLLDHACSDEVAERTAHLGKLVVRAPSISQHRENLVPVHRDARFSHNDLDCLHS